METISWIFLIALAAFAGMILGFLAGTCLGIWILRKEKDLLREQAQVIVDLYGHIKKLLLPEKIEKN